MSAFQEPAVSLKSVNLENINFNGANLLCLVEVLNPNGIDIPFPETDWQLFVNTNPFINGTVRNNQRIKARDTTFVEVPVNLDYQEVINSFRSLLGSSQAGYKVALELKFSAPALRGRVWNFEHEGSFPMPQLPQIRTPTMRMENANITRAEMIVTINVVNPNPFPIPTPRFSYDYQLNRNSFIKGDVENDRLLSANSTTPVIFRLVVNYADLFRSFSAMRNLFEVPSLLILTCDFGIPLFSGETLRFEIPGTLPVLR